MDNHDEITIPFRANAIQCPVCGGRPGRIYRCNQCGEVRCGLNDCTGSHHGLAGWAGTGSRCRGCGDGRYQPLNVASPEMSQFIRVYRAAPMRPKPDNSPSNRDRSSTSSGFRKYQQPEFLR